MQASFQATKFSPLKHSSDLGWQFIENVTFAVVVSMYLCRTQYHMASGPASLVPAAIPPAPKTGTIPGTSYQNPVFLP
jgi:hypothetical protein